MHASFVPFEESQWIRMTLVVVIGRSSLVSFVGLAYQGKNILCLDSL
jgi:hypothetical protein